MTLKMPGGNPASSKSLANSSVEAGVCSAVFATKVQPAARASFLVKRSSGEFHGTMALTTPTGSLLV